MRLSKPIEKTGFFWLPENTEKKLPGVLRISESGEVILEVLGLSEDHHLPRPFDEMPFLPGEEAGNRIVGIVGENKFVTLDQCLRVNLPFHFPGLWKSTFHARFAFIGFAVESGEDIAFSRIDFSVEGLDEWLGISGIHADYNWEEKSASVQFDPPDEIAFQLSNGIEMKIGFTWELPSWPAITEAKITQKAYISLVSAELQPLDDFIPLLLKIHTFLSFAIDRPVSLRSVTGYSTEITREFREGKKREVPIEVYYQSLPRSEAKSEIKPFDMLFIYRDVENHFEEIINRWLKNYEISGPAFNLYFTYHFDSYYSDSHRLRDVNFLLLVQGIETLHRRNSQEMQMPDTEFRTLVDTILGSVPDSKKEWVEEKLRYANELPLRKRISKMIEPFDKFFGSRGKQKRFINKVVEVRNYLTHYDSNVKTQTNNDNDLSKMLMLHTKLEALFQLHFLRIIGMEVEFIENIVNKNHKLRFKLGLRQQNSSEEPA